MGLPMLVWSAGEEGGLPAVDRAIEHLELEKASALCLQSPDAKLRAYYQMRILFVRHLVSEPPGFLDKFIGHSKSVLQTLEGVPDADPHKEWMMGEVFFLRGVVRAMHKQMVSSAVDMKSACDLLYKSHLKYPKQKDPLKLLGLFHVAMSAIPKKLQWLGNVLCFKGDLDVGLQYLEAAARGGAFLPNEAQVLLFYFEKNLLSKPEAAQARALGLKNRYPESKIYNYLLLSSQLELRQIDAAIALGKEMEPRFRTQEESEALPIWHYSLGKAYFFRLAYSEAIQQFDRFLGLYQGSTLRADALYRKGMALALSDRYPEAKRIFMEFAGKESSQFDADEYARMQAAQYILRAPSRLDRRLYAARNLFDGGYYDRSLDSLTPLLKVALELNENQRTELYYRLARNYHALERVAEAKKYYEDANASKPTSALWMKVYSLYYLGRIYESRGETEVAKQYYKQALEYDDYPYQSGLEQRTKAALHQLKHGISSPSQKGSSSSGSSF